MSIENIRQHRTMRGTQASCAPTLCGIAIKKSVFVFVAALFSALLLASCSAVEQPSEAPAEPQITVEEPTDGGLTVTFLDVGQGDCTYIACGGENLLIDAGNVGDGEMLVSYLGGLGIDGIDYAVCTHAHEDHCGGMAAVLAKFDVGVVFSPVTERDTDFFNNMVKYAEKQGLELTVPSAGDSFGLGCATVTVLGPVCDYEDTNNTSLVLRIDYGETSFLFTGDMESDAESDLLASGASLSADVLKVGHHGSSSSTSYVFLREVMPSYAVISCGTGNSYGHPHEEALSRLRDEGATLYRTDLQGTITCFSDGKTLTFTTDKTAAVTNPTEAEGESYYIGNINSHVYHLPTCSGLPIEKNRVIFQNLEDAVSAGYTPCSHCIKP